MQNLTRRALALAVAVTAAAPAFLATAARAADEVDLLLVLSSDVSRSIDAPKFKLQRDGYAAAIMNPRVIQAIRSGALGKIGVRQRAGDVAERRQHIEPMRQGRGKGWVALIGPRPRWGGCCAYHAEISN